MGHNHKILQNSLDIIDNILDVNVKSLNKYKL